MQVIYISLLSFYGLSAYEEAYVETHNFALASCYYPAFLRRS